MRWSIPFVSALVIAYSTSCTADSPSQRGADTSTVSPATAIVGVWTDVEMDLGDSWAPRGQAASQIDLRADGTVVIRGGPRGADSSVTLRWMMAGCELTLCGRDVPKCDPEVGSTIVLEGVDASTAIAYSVIMSDGTRMRTRWKRKGAGQPLDCPRPEALLAADERRRADRVAGKAAKDEANDARAAQQEADETDELRRAAKAAGERESGDLVAAAATIRAGLELYEFSGALLIERARVELADDRAKDALGTADLVRRVDPDRREYALIEGQALIELGRHDEARDSLEFLIDLGVDGVATETIKHARQLIEELPGGSPSSAAQEARHTIKRPGGGRP